MTEAFEQETERQDGERVERSEFHVSGQELVDKVKDLIHQGNIRRIVIKKDGERVMELPLSVATVGALLAPLLAAVGAFAALVTECTIVVERVIEE